MQYISTRGDTPAVSFSDAMLAGLAPDGGLYVPTEWPSLSSSDLRDFATLTYDEVAARVLEPFFQPCFDADTLQQLTREAYATFRHKEVVPVSELNPIGPASSAGPASSTGPAEHLVELYWGPTFSFKDIALQLLGRLFEHELARRSQTITIVGATSGDTGSAAIEACRDRAGIQLVMLHPAGRITEIQRRQMTTVTADNIFNVAIDGTFDDCQDLVKAMFSDQAFRSQMRLAAVNSINWARVAAQIVYYVTTAVKLGAPQRAVSFCVPTGNFGNILAGHIARRIGVPIEQLIIASNHNDILTRTYNTGTMKLEPVVPSSSPAMDIAVSSNFERLLFELSGQAGHEVAATMTEFRASQQGAALSAEVLAGLRAGFAAGSASQAEVAATIAQVLEQTGRLIDPHTAVAVSVARKLLGSSSTGLSSIGAGEAPVAIMSTAHPAKFSEAVSAAIGGTFPSVAGETSPAAGGQALDGQALDGQALDGQALDMPAELARLMDLPERCELAPNDLAAVKEIVAARAAHHR